MLFAQGARELTKTYAPKDATLRELLDESHNAILESMCNGDYSTTVIVRKFVPRDVRRAYKKEMKKELGYRLSCDWDDRASIIRIRW